MRLPKLIPLVVVSSLCLLLVTACSQSGSSDLPSQDNGSDAFTLQVNPDVEGIVLNGVFVAPRIWTLGLATPLLIPPQQTVEERYSIRVNDTTEQLAISVSEISKGPLHFSAVVGQEHLPIRQLTLFEHSTQLETIQNERLLPPESEWLSRVRLVPQDGELCLIWPDDLFAQAALLSVYRQGRLQLRQQSSESPLCADFEAAEQMEWRVNLRNPMFAVQLITNP